MHKNIPRKRACLVRILGIDYGKKRIGLAITSLAASFALPLTTIEHTGSISRAFQLLKHKLAELKDVTEIALGWPLYLDGNTSPLCTDVAELKRMLDSLENVTVYLIDERLTSKIAEESYRSHGYSRKDRKAHLDQAAAMLILNAHLDQKNHKKTIM